MFTLKIDNEEMREFVKTMEGVCPEEAIIKKHLKLKLMKINVTTVENDICPVGAIFMNNQGF